MFPVPVARDWELAIAVSVVIPRLLVLGEHEEGEEKRRYQVDEVALHLVMVDAEERRGRMQVLADKTLARGQLRGFVIPSPTRFRARVARWRPCFRWQTDRRTGGAARQHAHACTQCMPCDDRRVTESALATARSIA